MICKICNEEHPPLGMASHCKYKHKMTVHQYYDTYLKQENEGKCEICGKPIKFTTILNGYNRFCSKECQFEYQKTDEYKRKLNKTIQQNKNNKAGIGSVQKKIEPERTIGTGNESVYVYYYQIYKNRAIQNNSEVFECKIGMTTVDAQGRVIGQFGTAYPEFPVIALVIKCNSAKKLENTLHYLLDIRGKHIKNSPGSEWYMTNPTEVEELYKTIMGENK